MLEDLEMEYFKIFNEFPNIFNWVDVTNIKFIIKLLIFGKEKSAYLALLRVSFLVSLVFLTDVLTFFSVSFSFSFSLPFGLGKASFLDKLRRPRLS